jgi:hypothetical protein
MGESQGALYTVYLYIQSIWRGLLFSSLCYTGTAHSDYTGSRQEKKSIKNDGLVEDKKKKEEDILLPFG